MEHTEAEKCNKSGLNPALTFQVYVTINMLAANDLPPTTVLQEVKMIGPISVPWPSRRKAKHYQLSNLFSKRARVNQ